MAYEVRQNKEVPPQFLADVIGYLERTYGSRPSKELIDKMYSSWRQQWRQGATYREAAKATCSCERGVIVPSPGVDTQYEKGSVRPPRGAKPGERFSGEQVRLKGAPLPAPASPPAKLPKAARKPAQPKPPRKKAKAEEPKQPVVPPPSSMNASTAVALKESEAALMGSAGAMGDDDL